MLTKKQQKFFNTIFKFYQKNYYLPSIGELKKIFDYKSYNTLYKYLLILENKGYLKYSRDKKKIIYLNQGINSNNFFKIPIINDQDVVEVTNLELNKEYLAIRIHNNRMNSYHLQNKDIIIIEKTLNNLNNKLVCVLIDDKYKILKYEKKDSFIYLFDDYNSYLLTSFNKIIGKVKMVIRTL